MAQTFGLSSLVSCLWLAPIPSCVWRKNSIWSTHPLPTELPVTCEIPDVVGVRGWYKRFLSCMGIIYSLMYSSTWLPTCLAWGFFSVVFVISRKNLIFLIDTCWEHRNTPISTYCCPLLSGSTSSCPGFWSSALPKLKSLLLLEWLWSMWIWSLSLQPLWHFQRLLCALWWQARLPEVAIGSLKCRHFLGWLLLRRQILALAKSSDSYSALHRYNA